LPRLSKGVPRTLHTLSGSAFVATLADEMVAADVLELPQRLPSNLKETQLVHMGLRTWWKRISAPLQIFNWDLVVEERPECNTHTPKASDINRPNFFISLQNGQDSLRDVPRLNISDRVSMLEEQCPGMGETVLTALYDACRLLPGINTPRETMVQIAFTYWQGCDDEAEYLDYLAEEMEGATPAERLKNAKQSYDGPTREWIDSMIPRWVQTPERRRSRDDIAFRATSKLARAVATALDNMVLAASAKPLISFSHDDAEGFCTSVSLFLNWDDQEVVYRAFDDLANDAAQAGEEHHYQDLFEFVPGESNLKKWKKGMENMIHLAQATEELVRLIGVRCE
jgi:PRTRC genetic system protein F